MTQALQRGARRPALHGGLVACALALFATFVALGTWQVERRAWKLDLIARVNQRVSAPPAALPVAAAWPQVNAANDEYRHVRLAGQYLLGRDVRVKAVTAIGSGFWRLVPLQVADGRVVWINQGFVPPHWTPPTETAPNPGTLPSGPTQMPVTVTGLLRLTEPGGGFLRTNDPAADRWFSRDVAAMSAARGLHRVAPFFVDADAATLPHGPDAPVGGLTVVAFHNNHLVYAVTWYALALMVAGAAIGVAVQNRKHHDNPHSADPAD